MQADELIARARDALRTPTLYILGGGGFYADEPQPHPQPGVVASVKSVLDALSRHDPDKRARYEAEARAAGIDLEALKTRRMPFCDCSGFVCWALGLPRAPSKDARSGWIWTQSIYQDALRPGADFARVDSDAARLVCRRGAMLVFPSPGGDEPGHVGIVSETDTGGIGRPLPGAALLVDELPRRPGRGRPAQRHRRDGAGGVRGKARGARARHRGMASQRVGVSARAAGLAQPPGWSSGHSAARRRRMPPWP